MWCMSSYDEHECVYDAKTMLCVDIFEVSSF